MNNELRQLFDIKKDDQPKFTTDQNVVKHLLTRLLIVGVITIGFIVASNQSGGGTQGLGYLLLMATFHIFFIFFIIIEAIILNANKKKKLRNINIIFSVSFLMFYALVYLFLCSL